MKKASMKCEQTDRRGLDEFVEIDCSETGAVIQYGFPETSEYLMTATLGIKFWANPAQYVDARKTATHALMCGIYEDVLKELPFLRLAISNGDKKAAYLVVERLEKVCKDIERLS